MLKSLRWLPLLAPLFILYTSLASAQEKSALKCSEVLVEAGKTTGRPNILNDFRKDPSSRLIISQSAENVEPQAPILLSQKMQAFRNRYLPVFKNRDQREALILQMETDLRLSSFQTMQKLARNQESFYDLILVGAGVHGVVFLNKFLEENPNARVLVVDQNDSVASTFRYLGDSLTLNSSNRASGFERLPLPGQGNINELPGLPIQVSDMTAVKYPTGNDLASAVIAGFWANVRNNPQVDVALSTQVELFLTSAREANSSYTNGALLKLASGENVTVRSLVLQTMPGLGESFVPEKLLQTLRSNPQKVSPEKNQKLPRVMLVADSMRDIWQGKSTLDALKGETLVIAGGGDYAYVQLEALLGYMVSSGYGTSTAQTVGPAKILWVGQSIKTCREFIEKIRNRYGAIGTGLRPSSGALEALITPIEAKLNDVSFQDDKILSLLIDGKSIVSDRLILATGFQGQLRRLYESGRAYENDTVFLDESFNFIRQTTRLSEGQLTNVGRVLKANPLHFVGSPGTGPYPVRDELFGIVQNAVSIFNNAERSISEATYVGQAYRAAKRKIRQQDLRSTPANVLISIRAEKTGPVLITQITERRAVGAYSETVLNSMLKTALMRARFHAKSLEGSSLQFTLALSKDKKSIVIDSPNQMNVKDFAEILASTRDFFNLAWEFLQANQPQKLIFEIPTTKNIVQVDNLQMKVATSARISNPEITVANSKLVRGLEKRVGLVSNNQSVKVSSKSRQSELTSEGRVDFNFGSLYGGQVYHSPNGKALLTEGDFDLTQRPGSPFVFKIATIEKSNGQFRLELLLTLNERLEGIVELDKDVFLTRSETNNTNRDATYSLVEKDGVPRPLLKIGLKDDQSLGSTNFSRITVIQDRVVIEDGDGLNRLVNYNKATKQVSFTEFDVGARNSQILRITDDEAYVKVSNFSLQYFTKVNGVFKKTPFKTSKGEVISVFKVLEDGSVVSNNFNSISIAKRMQDPVELKLDYNERVEDVFRRDDGSYVALVGEPQYLGAITNYITKLAVYTPNPNGGFVRNKISLPMAGDVTFGSFIQHSNGSFVGVVSRKPNYGEANPDEYRAGDVIAYRILPDNSSVSVNNLFKNKEGDVEVSGMSTLKELPTGDLLLQAYASGLRIVFPLVRVGE